MLENVIGFFKKLPAKVCTSCGKEIEGQHQRHNSKCDTCNIL